MVVYTWVLWSGQGVVFVGGVWVQECVAGAYHDEDEDVLCESGGSANVSCHFAAFHAEIPRVFEVLVFCGSLLFNFAGKKLRSNFEQLRVGKLISRCQEGFPFATLHGVCASKAVAGWRVGRCGLGRCIPSVSVSLSSVHFLWYGRWVCWAYWCVRISWSSSLVGNCKARG